MSLLLHRCRVPAPSLHFRLGFLSIILLGVGITVFSLTLARSPMASRPYRRASDFLNYSPGLASDILAERKSEKKKKKIFFLKIASPCSHDTVAFQKLI